MSSTLGRWAAITIGTLMASSLAVMPATAQLSQNADEPIDITGERFEAFQNKDYALWTGDVQVVQGEVILTAPTLKIFGISGGNFSRIEAEGGIRYTNGVESISGNKALYEQDKDTIIVTGDVVVVQGRQVMTGQRMVYHIKTGQIRFDSSKSHRVRGVFFTDEENNSSS